MVVLIAASVIAIGMLGLTVTAFAIQTFKQIF